MYTLKTADAVNGNNNYKKKWRVIVRAIVRETRFASENADRFRIMII